MPHLGPRTPELMERLVSMLDGKRLTGDEIARQLAEQGVEKARGGKYTKYDLAPVLKALEGHLESIGAALERNPATEEEIARHVACSQGFWSERFQKIFGRSGPGVWKNLRVYSITRSTPLD